MSRMSRLLALGVLVYAATVLIAACGRKPETSKASLLPPSAATAPVRALMAGVIDPAADVVWNSVGSILRSPTITEERVPKNDEEWATVRQNALMLMEAGDLLLMPGRPMAGPGEKSNTPGVELEPAEIEANVSKNQERWTQVVKAFQDASLEALKAIEAKDRDKLFDVGERLDAACEACHTTFWYPGQILPPGYEEPPPLPRNLAPRR